jgi:hypothetical protein
MEGSQVAPEYSPALSLQLFGLGFDKDALIFLLSPVLNLG